MTVSEVANHLHRLPRLNESTVFQIERSEEGRGPRTAGGFETTLTRRTTYRVLLKTEYKCADCERPHLWQALEDAFGIVGLPLPEDFAFLEI